MEIGVGLRRWEISADQRRCTSEVGDRRCRCTNRLLSYLGLGLCWESNRAMVTEGEENKMKELREAGRLTILTDMVLR